MHERRSRLRLPVRRLVWVEPGGSWALTGDLSVGGAFLITARIRAPGTRLRLRFQTPTRTVRVEGVVRWVRPRADPTIPHAAAGMGVEFVAPEAAPAGGKGP